MRRFPFFLSLAAVFAVFLAVQGFGQEPPKQGRNLLMQQKLGHSQKVLEALAIKDFDLLERHASALVLVSKQAEWLVLKTPDYLRFSEEFRRSADTMARSAKEKNLDAAALAYLQTTMACVNCHKHVREVRVAAGPSPRDGSSTLGR